MQNKHISLQPLDNEDLIFKDELNNKWVSVKGMVKILSGCRLKNFGGL